MPAYPGGPSCCWVSLSVRLAAGQLTQNLSWPVTPSRSLATALKMNMNLRELYLADNKLNGLQDSAQLGNLLKFNCSLHILDLRNNHVLDSGALPPTPAHAGTSTSVPSPVLRWEMPSPSVSSPNTVLGVYRWQGRAGRDRLL